VVCVENALQNVVLVTTRWENFDEAAGSQQEKQLKETQWKEMVDQGSSNTLRYSSTLDSAWNTIDHFVETANSRYAELLQEEMANMKNNLMADHASFEWSRLEKLVEKQQEMMQKIRTQTKQQSAQRLLHDGEYEDLHIQLATIFTEMQALNIPLGKYLLRVFSPPWN
jgi:NurA-like 5'-3' nuclease